MRKSKLALALLVGTVMAGSVCGITACNNNPQPEEPKSDVVLNFVAVTKTAWDADTTFTSVVNEKDYNLTYKLSLDLNKDKTLKLTGTCQSGSEKQEGGNQGGGSGGPRGGGAPAMVAEGRESEPETPAITDWSPYNFTMNGTWTEQKGWGYTVKIDNTEIKVDYDLTQGRHTFYYYAAPTINNKKSSEVLVQMQAKDSAYRKTLASDYETYHAHECTYDMYVQNGSGKINVYLMPGGSIGSYSVSGNSYKFSGKGEWSENTTNHTLSVTVDGKTYNSNAYEPNVGYRVTYSSTVMGFISTSANKKSNQLTDRDFEGTTALTLTGTDTADTKADYTLELTQKGFAVIYKADGSRLAVCTYTKADDVYTVTYGEQTYTSTQEGNVLTITVAFSITTVGMSNQTTTTNYNIPFSVTLTA